MMHLPNLDCMTESDLHAFADAHTGSNRSAALNLIGRRKGYMKLDAKLVAYALNKATAMWCRERGDILSASIYEQICDNIYESLPSDLRW